MKFVLFCVYNSSAELLSLRLGVVQLPFIMLELPSGIIAGFGLADDTLWAKPLVIGDKDFGTAPFNFSTLERDRLFCDCDSISNIIM